MLIAPLTYMRRTFPTRHFPSDNSPVEDVEQFSLANAYDHMQTMQSDETHFVCT